MRNSDLPEFAKLLTDFLMGYGKPAPDSATTAFWFRQLSAFSPATIGKAFAAYQVERPDFAPAPNGIVARCKLMDGRPDENEAWAMALASRDERETVTWTTEMQEAFGLCKGVLDGGDEIGARMAFKDAYTRLVTAARAGNVPVKWSVSEGWDKERKELVIARAIAAGALPAPPVHLQLEYEGGMPAERPEGLKRVLEACKQLEDPHVKAERRRIQFEEEERFRAQQIDAQVKQYRQDHPEAR